MTKAFCYAAMFALLSFAALCLRATWMLNDLDPQIRAELSDLNRVTLSIGGTAAELRASAKEWKAASQQSEQISRQTVTVLQNSAQATEALTAMIQHTDYQVNGTLLPELAATVRENNERLSKLTTDSDATVVAMGSTAQQSAATMAQATQTLAQAAKVLGDPAIPKIMANTETTSQNVAQATAHLNNSTAMIEVKVRQMTKPLTFAQQLGKSAVELAAPVVSILK